MPLVLKISHYVAGTLGPDHILELSKRITNDWNLREIATALRISEDDIDSTLHDNKGDIRSAAHHLLKVWREGIQRLFLIKICSSKFSQTDIIGLF